MNLPDGQYLGLDFGLRRIGVASGNSFTRTASPLCTLDARDGEPDWRALTALLSQWRPVALVVGVPLHMDGQQTRSTAPARALVEQLQTRYTLPVFQADERLSSRVAEDMLRQSRQQGGRRRIQKSDIDRSAAALILENWLTQRFI